MILTTARILTLDRGNSVFESGSVKIGKRVIGLSLVDCGIFCAELAGQVLRKRKTS